ncbi:nucleoside hydrolase [Benzoatithermus flavus]|uniref:Nucleoside hydrolase n=1 Tax=Benzoatithermus flavus TaxID=3108223 RepID=A0ABU8XS98_9PROT
MRQALKRVLVAAAMLLACAAPARAAEKVVFDTDFNTMGDDGQAFVMLVQAMREAKVEILGMTVVSGNQWLDQEVADALKAVERMGVAGKVKVYPGALYPLVHDQATLELEQKLFGKGYAGAWRSPRPKPDGLIPPPDGFAQNARPETTHAVDFLIDAIRRNPNEVTILAVGPLTNLALAFRKDPDIVPLVKRIVYMGGAIEVPGNVTPAAEFNWWFDPEAARIVLRQPVEHVIVPLDVTNTARFDRKIYERISAAGTPVATLFQAVYAKKFASDPAARAEVWDTLAAAYVLDSSLATDLRELQGVDVDIVFGPDYGRSLGYGRNPPVGVQRAKVVFGLDLDRFWAMYTDLLTRPVGG